MFIVEIDLKIMYENYLTIPILTTALKQFSFESTFSLLSDDVKNEIMQC